MKKIIIFTLTIFLISSCKKNEELILNEKVANEFLKEMNALDEFEAKYFADSTALKKSPSNDNSTEVKDAIKLSEDANKGLKSIMGYSVSPEAMSFYIGASKYIDVVHAQGNDAKDFFTEADPGMRKGYYNRVKENFKKLRNKPDSILSIQKIYLEKVGLK